MKRKDGIISVEEKERVDERRNELLKGLSDKEKRQLFKYYNTLMMFIGSILF